MQTFSPIAFNKAFSFITSLILGSWCFALPSENYDPGRLTATTIYDKLDQPMELEVAKDGRIFFIELNGEFRVFLPETQEAVLIHKFDVARRGEVGLIGLALDPKFSQNGWVYYTHMCRATGTASSCSTDLTAGSFLPASSFGTLFTVTSSARCTSQTTNNTSNQNILSKARVIGPGFVASTTTLRVFE